MDAGYALYKSLHTPQGLYLQFQKPLIPPHMYGSYPVQNDIFWRLAHIYCPPIRLPFTPTHMGDCGCSAQVPKGVSATYKYNTSQAGREVNPYQYPLW